MYIYKQPRKTSIKPTKLIEGETIEQKMRRVRSNNEPIKDGSPLVYTARDEGIKPEFNIRNDKWEQGTEITSNITDSHIKDREKRHKDFKEKMEKENKLKQPPQATGDKGTPSGETTT